VSRRAPASERSESEKEGERESEREKEREKPVRAHRERPSKLHVRKKWISQDGPVPVCLFEQQYIQGSDSPYVGGTHTSLLRRASSSDATATIGLAQQVFGLFSHLGAQGDAYIPSLNGQDLGAAPAQAPASSLPPPSPAPATPRHPVDVDTASLCTDTPAPWERCGRRWRKARSRRWARCPKRGG